MLCSRRDTCSQGLRLVCCSRARLVLPKKLNYSCLKFRKCLLQKLLFYNIIILYFVWQQRWHNYTNWELTIYIFWISIKTFGSKTLTVSLQHILKIERYRKGRFKLGNYNFKKFLYLLTENGKENFWHECRLKSSIDKLQRATKSIIIDFCFIINSLSEWGLFYELFVLFEWFMTFCFIWNSLGWCICSFKIVSKSSFEMWNSNAVQTIMQETWLTKTSTYLIIPQASIDSVFVVWNCIVRYRNMQQYC